MKKIVTIILTSAVVILGLFYAGFQFASVSTLPSESSVRRQSHSSVVVTSQESNQKNIASLTIVGQQVKFFDHHLE